MYTILFLISSSFCPSYYFMLQYRYSEPLIQTRKEFTIMKIYDFTIKSVRGLHAQPCAALAAVACNSSCDVVFEYNDQTINVADPIQLMSSMIRCGERIILKVSGNDEDDTMEKLKEIIHLQLS